MSANTVEGMRVRWTGGALERVETCPACSSSERILHAGDVTDHLDLSGPDRWSIWRCLACGSLYLDARPSADSLGFAYRSYYTHNTDDHAGARQQGIVWALIHGYLNRRFGTDLRPSLSYGAWLFACVEPLRLKLDYHGRHLFLAANRGRRGDVLDVGCGNGEFLRRAASMGWTAAGLDPDPSAVEVCRQAGFEAFGGSITDMASGHRYDVVTLRHSIEHVADPLATLKACGDRLRAGGMIWLAWPNPESVGARLLGKTWRGLEVPRHLCIPSARAMRKLLREAGFIDVRAIRRGHHARGIMRESRRIARSGEGHKQFLRAAFAPAIGWLADILATFSPQFGEELVMVARLPASSVDSMP